MRGGGARLDGINPPELQLFAYRFICHPGKQSLEGDQVIGFDKILTREGKAT